MSLVLAARIDDGDIAAPDDIGAGSREGEGPGLFSTSRRTSGETVASSAFTSKAVE